MLLFSAITVPVTIEEVPPCTASIAPSVEIEMTGAAILLAVRFTVTLTSLLVSFNVPVALPAVFEL